MKSFFGSFERMIRFKNTPKAICGEGPCEGSAEEISEPHPAPLAGIPK